MERKHNKTMKVKDNLTKEEAKFKIQQFMLNTTAKRRVKYLTRVCSESGICIAFGGKERQKINKFFDNFLNFNYIVTPIKSIGTKSANGFIKELKFVKDEYVAYAILKSTNSKTNDNLMYEYNVGKYINKFIDVFPCFLETYGLFLYNNHIKWLHSKTVNTISTNVLHNSLTIMPVINYRWGCMRSNYLAIMIQHIKNCVTLHEIIDDTLKLDIFKTLNFKKKTQFFNYELISILYQVYMPLASICDTFTHYDLHLSNIILFEPQTNHFIEYHYHLTADKTITFKSKYMAKIIDYGRCYFNDKDDGTSSLDIYNELCSIDKCEPNCGYDMGFATLNPRSNLNIKGLILSQKKNISHDLRAIAILNKLVSKTGLLDTHVSNFFNSVNYNKTYKLIGTEEIIGDGYPYSINNVRDVPKMLENIINNISYQTNNSIEYGGLKKIGDLHIYSNNMPMEFIKTSTVISPI